MHAEVLVALALEKAADPWLDEVDILLGGLDAVVLENEDDGEEDNVGHDN